MGVVELIKDSNALWCLFMMFISYYSVDVAVLGFRIFGVLTPSTEKKNRLNVYIASASQTLPSK